MQVFDNEQKRIAIVGGGASGIATFIAAVRQRAAATIFIVDPAPVGQRTAFSTSDDDLICNTSVDLMSVIPEARHDFLDYLTSLNYQATPSSYVPRRLVGEYLTERYREYREIARRRGIEVIHLPWRFDTLRIEGQHRYRLLFTETFAEPLVVSDVIFCTGYDVPRVPDIMVPYQKHPTFIGSPFPEARMLAKVTGKSRVLVVGSKLSAIDAAILLCREGHQVTMLSPSGRLPTVRASCVRNDSVSWDLDYIASFMRHIASRSPASLNFTLFRHVIRALSKNTAMPWRRQFSYAVSPAERLREEIAIAERGECQWQDMIVTFVDALNWLYVRNRDQFQGKLSNFLEVLYPFFTAAALPNAQKLMRYIDEGRLEIKRGTLDRLDASEPDAGFWLTDWGNGSQSFDAIVNSTGYLGQTCIFNAGEIKFDTTGFRPEEVLDICLDMSATHPELHRKESIWFVGPAARARLLVSNALFVIAPLADEVIANMMNFSSSGNAWS
ncbi:FAD/NAD(P)-binding protein [Brucella intermedia]|uniref:FAD/NAD(P)-binding protein n=1 Tax=Brucella intermedia TaxID=94625 RepID=UPI0023603601|nr:FAD/NAD(P)-binding protein [Brucella intermedia]